MFKFSDIVEIQGQSECVADKNVSHRKESTENINDRSETEFASVEDPLNMHRTASNKTTLVSDIPNIINDENVIIAPGQGKKPASFLRDDFCEEQAFPYVLPKDIIGYNVPQDIPITPSRYLNQRLLNFNQYLASDADYIFFAWSVYEQRYLRSSINFTMHKIKPGALTAGMVKNYFKATIEKFVASDNVFSFMSSVKGTPAYWKQFLYDVLAMFKKLDIPTYFLILSCVDLRWGELPYITNKLNNLDLSDRELKTFSYQERCNLLNKKPVLVPRHFQYKVEVFFKKIILDCPLGKTKYYAMRIEFKGRGSSKVHSFIWIFNAPNIQNETAYIEFIEKTINAQLPDHLKEP